MLKKFNFHDRVWSPFSEFVYRYGNCPTVSSQSAAERIIRMVFNKATSQNGEVKV